MLVLSRKKEERIFIGKDIKIVIVEIRGNKVRIGIDAPEDVAIAREEIAKGFGEEKRPLSEMIQ